MLSVPTFVYEACIATMRKKYTCCIEDEHSVYSGSLHVFTTTGGMKNSVDLCYIPLRSLRVAPTIFYSKIYRIKLPVYNEGRYRSQIDTRASNMFQTEKSSKACSLSLSLSLSLPGRNNVMS